MNFRILGGTIFTDFLLTKNPKDLRGAKLSEKQVMGSGHGEETSLLQANRQWPMGPTAMGAFQARHSFSNSYRVLLTVTAFTVQAVHIWTVPYTTSPTQWTWVWINSGSWWWTGRPGVLQSMESQRVGQDWVAELNWTYTTLHTLQCYSVEG